MPKVKPMENHSEESTSSVKTTRKTRITVEEISTVNKTYHQVNQTQVEQDESRPTSRLSTISTVINSIISLFDGSRPTSRQGSAVSLRSTHSDRSKCYVPPTRSITPVESDSPTSEANQSEHDENEPVFSIPVPQIIKTVPQAVPEISKANQNEKQPTGNTLDNPPKNERPISPRKSGRLSPRQKFAHMVHSNMASIGMTKTKAADLVRVHTRRKNISGMQFHDADEMKTISDSLLYKTLRPLIICMKLSGIFFVRKKAVYDKTFLGLFHLVTPLQVWCMFVILILFLNLIRSTFAFSSQDGFGSLLFFKILTSIFMYESWSRACLAYWGCWRKKTGYQDIFLRLEKICYTDKIIPYEDSLRKTMFRFLILCLVISTMNAGFAAYGMFGPSQELYASYLIPVPEDSFGIEIYKGFVIFILFMNSIVAILSLTFYTIICYVLYKEFEYLCRLFVMKIKDDGSFNDNMERFRQMHQKRCKLVQETDQMFKYYIANTYTTNVPLLCLLLYGVVYVDDLENFSSRMISAFRLLYVMLQMVVLSVAATLINSQAHAPLEDIYSIKVEATTKERQLELNMFLNKLTGTSVGLTAWDMFVINKPTVLTVVGMILTYFFLLLQFKNPLSPYTICTCLFEGLNQTYSLKELTKDTHWEDNI